MWSCIPAGLRKGIEMSTPRLGQVRCRMKAARGDPDGREDVARRLYDAEVALHIARQSGVDGWVAAASDRLHEAVIAYRARLPETGRPAA